MPRWVNAKQFRVGDTYGRLTFVLRDGVKAFAVCSCGTQVHVFIGAVMSGHTKSCGCLRKDLPNSNLTHGMSKTKTYKSWVAMIERCTKQTHHAYMNYGGRGITVAKRWMKFENFYADMGIRPEGRTLDRKNNDLGYSKRNCRWATPVEQAQNRRSSSKDKK